MKPRKNLPQTEIDQIINGSQACFVGMVDLEGKPYVLPFNFAYEDGRLFIHSGPEGKKIDIWNKNPEVCISFSTDYEVNVRHEKVACSYSMKYRSVLVHGKVVPIVDLDEKGRILNIVMGKYAGRNDFSFGEPALKNVSVFEVLIQKQESRSYLY